MKEQKLFIAIGGAEEALLKRSEQKPHAWLRRGLVAAAFLALVICGYWALSPADPLISEEPPRAVLRLSGSAVGKFHLLQLDSTDAADTNNSEFVLYVNEAIYRSFEQNGAYVVQPIVPSPDGLPPCRMEITHLAGIPLGKAAEAAVQKLQGVYQNVAEPTESASADGLLVHGDNGSSWDAAQLDVYLVDDRQGGVYRIAASYFTEAAEGHGARFSDMVGTFEVTAGADAPAWFTGLRQAASNLIPALFSNHPDDAAAFLSDGAQIDGYGRDVSSEISISAIDFTVDNDQEPAHAVISVRHRLSTEDSYSYLTIELSYQNNRWRADWTGIEK